jgi:hypothetical protein
MYNALMENPLHDIIDDMTYQQLEKLNLLSEKGIRDYTIRRIFRELRNDMSAGDAIDRIRDLYPYLQFDTVRKIVYQISK